MSKHQHEGYILAPASKAEPLMPGTYIVADEWSSTEKPIGAQDKIFIAESLVTQPARALANNDDDESGMSIQVIDLEEDENDDGNEDGEDEAEEEEGDFADSDDDHGDSGTAFHFVRPVAVAGAEDEFDEVIEEEFDDDDDGARDYNAVSPALTAGDVDADWKRAEVTGEETPGGSVATPDQAVVDLIGRAAGVEYNDDEPLDFAEKIGRRDRDRWELDPASVDPDTAELSEEPPASIAQGYDSETRS